MKATIYLVFGIMLLSSCSIFEKGEYTPLYLQESSPLDPPGTDEARARMRAERVKEGVFAVGATPEVQQGRAYLLDRNPDFAETPSGRMVTTNTVKVISCEGTYYFVETENGERGFLRETDMVNPITLVATTDMVPLAEGEGTPGVDGLLPYEQAPMSDTTAPQLRINDEGKTVVVVGKKTEKSKEFEELKRQITEAAPEQEPAPAAPAEAEDFDAALPDPTGSAAQ